jgi:hypothetical protein
MAAGADLHNVCKKIIELDDTIRFVGTAGINEIRPN